MDFFDPLTVGSWPDWIAGLGTVAAFGLAVCIYFGNSRHQKKSQARFVHPLPGLKDFEGGAINFFPKGTTMESRLIGDERPLNHEIKGLATPVQRDEDWMEWKANEDSFVYRAHVENASDEIISGVVVGLMFGSDPYGPITSEGAGYLRPGATLDYSHCLLLPPGADILHTSMVPFVRFMDAAGIRWERRLDEPVRKIKKPRRIFKRQP